jgi:hypothetical protein
MLSTPQKRFVWARSERFADFSDFSFFRHLLKTRRERAAARIVKERPNNRWKPAPWTPWLWMK